MIENPYYHREVTVSTVDNLRSGRASLAIQKSDIGNDPRNLAQGTVYCWRWKDINDYNFSSGWAATAEQALAAALAATPTYATNVREKW